MREVVERVTCSIDGAQWIDTGDDSPGHKVSITLTVDGVSSVVGLDVCNNCNEKIDKMTIVELMRKGEELTAPPPATSRKRRKSTTTAKKRRGKEMTSAERWADQQLEDGGWACPASGCTQIKETAPALGRHIGASHPELKAVA
jgi:hypothetical protein